MSSARMVGNRIELVKVFGDRGKPGLNADIASGTESVREIADPDFEVIDSVTGNGNDSSDDVTYNAEGGILLTTDGADGDGLIIQPHADANQSPWEQFTWGTDNEVEWECWIKMGAAVTTRIVLAGLKLTLTDVIATDDDSAFFRYEDGVNSGKWQSNVSVAGTDNTVDTGIVGTANQFMHFKIVFDAAEICHMFVNGREVQAQSFAGNSADLIPFIGTEADGAAAASTLVVFGENISRKIS